MQEQRQTTTPNTYYNLVSVLYHTLQEAQTCAAYARDAQQAGQAELAQFFLEVQQNANREAERAQNFLERWNVAHSHHNIGYQGQYPSGMLGSQH